MQHFSDEHLVTLLRNDCSEAFSELYKRYWKKAYGYIYKKIAHTEETEEILQEVFVSLWNNRDSLFIQTSFSGYLFACCRYRIVDYYRDQQPFGALTEKELPLSFSHNQLEEQMQYEELQQQAVLSMRLLPGKCRSVFFLSRIKNKSTREIAEQLNISPKTVEQHISKAIRLLRIYLKDYVLVLITAFSYFF